MEIKTKKELKFVLQADKIMRGIGGGIYGKIRRFLSPDYIGRFLVEMRKTSAYKYQSRHQKGLLNKLLLGYHFAKYEKLGLKLGFTIGCDALGYGVVIPHYGTIVVGNTNRIGNYAVLQTSICISSNGKIIGDGLYMGTGAKITSKVKLGNNISVGANSLVNKDCLQDNVLLGGMPAKVLKPAETWYIRDSLTHDQGAFGVYSETFAQKVERVEALRKQYGIEFESDIR